MKFHNVQLPSEIAAFASASANFNTSRITTKSGQEIASNDCSMVHKKYTLHNCKLSLGQFDAFNNFFLARRGSRYGFFIKDQLDCHAEKENIEIASNNFKLIKTYPDNCSPYKRTILHPIEDSIKLKLGNRTFKDFKFDENSGEIILNTSIITRINVSASFDFVTLVRFVDDHYEYEFASDNTIILRNVGMQEVLL